MKEKAQTQHGLYLSYCDAYTRLDHMLDLETMFTQFCFFIRNLWERSYFRVV